ncbi:MAG: hypothetical protein V9G29_08410 [Burkholderiaceae bacterium]
MAVLVEAISVVVLRASIDARFPGGWANFQNAVPNDTLCFDAEIARVGFMAPEDVKGFIAHLESSGLRFLVNGDAEDIAVVDQLKGLTVRAPWLESGTIRVTDPEGQLTVCRALGSLDEELAVPDGWKFEGSLSERTSFMTDDEAKTDLQFLRTEGGLDVYLNKVTSKEVYVGRTARDH